MRIVKRGRGRGCGGLNGSVGVVGKKASWHVNAASEARAHATAADRLQLRLRPRLTKAAKGGGQLGNDATRCSTRCQSHDAPHRRAAQKPGENMGELIDEGGA